MANLIMQQIVCLSVWFTSFPFPLIVVRVLTQTKYSHVQFIVSWTLPCLVGQIYCVHSTAFLINYIHMFFGRVSPGFIYLTLSVILCGTVLLVRGFFPQPGCSRHLQFCKIMGYRGGTLAARVRLRGVTYFI
jgi:hypothetical protein